MFHQNVKVPEYMTGETGLPEALSPGDPVLAYFNPNATKEKRSSNPATILSIMLAAIQLPWMIGLIAVDEIVYHGKVLTDTPGQHSNWLLDALLFTWPMLGGLFAGGIGLARARSVMGRRWAYLSFGLNIVLIILAIGLLPR